MSASGGDVLVATLLGLACVAVATAVVGLTRAPSMLAALHYLGPAAVAAPLLLAAVVPGAGRELAFTLQAALLASFLVAASPFLAQLLGRAAHSGANGDGDVDADGAGDDEVSETRDDA